MQPVDPAVYVLIRIPKAGSTSLLDMVRDGLPHARHFGMPDSPHPSDFRPIGERLRATRARIRTLVRGYRTLSFAQAWKYVEAHASNGDLISGHIRYGDPVLPSFRPRYITLFRHPLARVLSNYNYSRLGFQKRNALRRAYVGGRIKAAGTYSFSGYLSYISCPRGCTSFTLSERAPAASISAPRAFGMRRQKMLSSRPPYTPIVAHI